jgi:hypothetical protein
VFGLQLPGLLGRQDNGRFLLEADPRLLPHFIHPLAHRFLFADTSKYHFGAGQVPSFYCSTLATSGSEPFLPLSRIYAKSGHY